MADRLDNIVIGQLYTARYLKNSGVISSPSWKSLYSPRYIKDKTSQDGGVINDGVDDTSNVFEISAMYSNAGLDVSIQDQNSDILDFYFMIELEDVEIAVVPTIGDRELALVDASNFVIGQFVGIQSNERNYQGQVQAIDTNTLTLDTPIDFEYPLTSQIKRKSRDLNVDGSITPIIATISPVTGISWDITRMLFSMTDATSMDDGKFGGGTELTNGVVFRVSGDLVTNNIFNAKTNGELALRAFNVVYSEKAPSGEYGLRFIRSFSGQDKNGVTIRLDGDNNDEMQMIIQDDLTDLKSFYGVIQGHIVE